MQTNPKAIPQKPEARIESAINFSRDVCGVKFDHFVIAPTPADSDCGEDTWFGICIADKDGQEGEFICLFDCEWDAYRAFTEWFPNEDPIRG